MTKSHNTTETIDAQAIINLVFITGDFKPYSFLKKPKLDFNI
jgi:hypothetical protein